MATIDLNSDLGENSAARRVSDDDAMLGVVTSANVACGFHAGEPGMIAETLRAAAGRGVTVGAHPSYRDWENFGREPLDVPAAVLQAEVEYQLGALAALARSAGTRVAYVKPHGALYNTAVRDEGVADTIIAAIRAVDANLWVLALAGSVLARRAENAGLRVAREAFADRAYAPSGTLVPRSDPGAVLHDPDEVSRRMLRLVGEGTVEAIDRTPIRVEADSICVHGDSAGAVEMARAIRALFEREDVTIRPFVSPLSGG